ncbi:MAG: hypothetical protein HC926_02600 [Synechococcaceae cyanobacterium SM2_3_60]|nr:hypothetical protein [Synechococcaceae cyanobacterium SM2_3_60]
MFWRLVLAGVCLTGGIVMAQDPGAENPSSAPLNPIIDLSNDAVIDPGLRPAELVTGPVDPYRQVLEQTVAMVHDVEAQTIANQAGLNIVPVTWEDTGRYHNSAVGPNISDLTIQVAHQGQSYLMPVLRYPNFSDLTADVSLDKLMLPVGNNQGEALETVSLREVLSDLPRFLHDPSEWQSSQRSLLDRRDSHVLVSAQAAFLPIPQGGAATFTPVLFNYQSYPGNPAVLTLLVTPEGTSITIIDNQQYGSHWGQPLFFNNDGQRARLTGERISDWRSREQEPLAPREPVDEAGLNLVMVIQVPLKQREAERRVGVDEMQMAPVPAAPMMSLAESAGRSDVEAAVISYGEDEGPFIELGGIPIERDTRFPIRVTVQFYQATSNGVISTQDVALLQDGISRVYADADYIGSLVVGDDRERPTASQGPLNQPNTWWRDFWRRQSD